MNLYRINEELENALEEAVDLDTGEIINKEALAKYEALQLTKDEKITSVACFIKNLKAQIEALKSEKQAFAQRQKIAENKMQWLKEMLKNVLQGGKFENQKAKITYRKNPETLEIIDSSIIPDEYKVITYDLDKDKIKKALQMGYEVEGARLTRSESLIIK